MFAAIYPSGVPLQLHVLNLILELLATYPCWLLQWCTQSVMSADLMLTCRAISWHHSAGRMSLFNVNVLHMYTVQLRQLYASSSQPASQCVHWCLIKAVW